jgi:hypothetical protein
VTHTYTREDFARALLPKIGARATKRNLVALVAWQRAEGIAGVWNPLGSTLDMPGATDFNSVGVKNYVSFLQGVEATARTLNYGADRGLYGYRAIRKRLRGNSFAWLTLRAVEKSAWGTGGLAKRVRGDVLRNWDFNRRALISQ